VRVNVVVGDVERPDVFEFGQEAQQNFKHLLVEAGVAEVHVADGGLLLQDGADELNHLQVDHVVAEFEHLDFGFLELLADLLELVDANIVDEAERGQLELQVVVQRIQELYLESFELGHGLLEDVHGFVLKLQVRYLSHI